MNYSKADDVNSIVWFAGAAQPLEELRVDGSAMNLWGSLGAYLSDSSDSAFEFGEFVTSFNVNAKGILFTDDDAPFDLVFEGLKWAKVPFMVSAKAQVNTYGELIALMGDYTGGDRKPAILWLRERIDFDAIYTSNVTAKRDSRDFSEGNVLVILDPLIATPNDLIHSPRNDQELDGTPDDERHHQPKPSSLSMC